MSFGAVMVASSWACSSEHYLGSDAVWEMLAILRFGPPHAGRPGKFLQTWVFAGNCGFCAVVAARFPSAAVGPMANGGGCLFFLPDSLRTV